MNNVYESTKGALYDSPQRSVISIVQVVSNFRVHARLGGHMTRGESGVLPESHACILSSLLFHVQRD